METIQQGAEYSFEVYRNGMDPDLPELPSTDGKDQDTFATEIDMQMFADYLAYLMSLELIKWAVTREKLLAYYQHEAESNPQAYEELHASLLQEARDAIAVPEEKNFSA